MDRLPLASVRAFEAVARLLSISRAAEELNVTPSAVSHQMKVLEDYLSTPLLQRERNRIRLTDAGERYLAHVSEGLLTITLATAAIKATKGVPPLRIAAPPGLATLWLTERLGRYLKSHPKVGLTLSFAPTNHASSEWHRTFDILLSYGGDDPPGFVIDPLGPNHVFPICRPSLLEGEHALRTPADLSRCTLLESSDESYYGRSDRQPVEWRAWLRAARASGVAGRRLLHFTPRALLHRAVVAGHGVGLTRTLLAVDALSNRDIAIPFGPALVQSSTYKLVAPPSVLKRTEAAAFRDWIIAEAQQSSRIVENKLKKLSR